MTNLAVKNLLSTAEAQALIRKYVQDYILPNDDDWYFETEYDCLHECISDGSTEIDLGNGNQILLSELAELSSKKLDQFQYEYRRASLGYDPFSGALSKHLSYEDPADQERAIRLVELVDSELADRLRVWARLGYYVLSSNSGDYWFCSANTQHRIHWEMTLAQQLDQAGEAVAELLQQEYEAWLTQQCRSIEDYFCSDQHVDSYLECRDEVELVELYTQAYNKRNR